MITLFLLSGVGGYLGDVCFELQCSWVRAETALSNLGTMLEITRSVAVITSNVNGMMRRMARTIGERHQYDNVGISLSGPDGQDMRLSGWMGDFENLEQYTRQSGHLIHQAINDLDLRFVQGGRSWSVAIPIRDNDSLMGVLLISSEEPGKDVSSATGLGDALVSKIAVGIRIADLRQRAEVVMTNYEWELLTRQIHDRISGSMHFVMLHLDADSYRYSSPKTSAAMLVALDPAGNPA